MIILRPSRVVSGASLLLVLACAPSPGPRSVLDETPDEVRARLRRFYEGGSGALGSLGAEP